jgi:energy-coupling factor transporter ATP-binding protein EcfA2
LIGEDLSRTVLLKPSKTKTIKKNLKIMFCFLLLLSLCVVFDVLANIETQNFVKLLQESENFIKFGGKNESVLVFGNTGAGKSTFLQWFAGDNSKLISREIREGSGEFIIVDGNDKIGSSTLNSKTIFPELISTGSTDFYDFPGFSDSRRTSHEIATTYFMKKICDRAKSVKLVFVTSYSSVRKGVDKQNFQKLLKHVTGLINDIDKFKNSIALVVTKVENRIFKQNGNFKTVSDGIVIETIADFIQVAKEDMQSKLTGEVSPQNQKFLENSVKLCDILLTKDNGQHSRIGVFRRPHESGPISEIELLQDGKRHIEKIINENLAFTAKVDDDFNFSLSDQTKNEISNSTLFSSFNEISQL